MDGLLVIVGHQTGPGPSDTAHVSPLGVIYSHPGRLAGLGVVSGQPSRLVQGGLRHFLPPAPDDDVGAGHASDMEPQVACGGPAASSVNLS